MIGEITGIDTRRMGRGKMIRKQGGGRKDFVFHRLVSMLIVFRH